MQYGFEISRSTAAARSIYNRLHSVIDTVLYADSTFSSDRAINYSNKAVT